MTELGELDGETVFTTSRLRCRRWLETDFDSIYQLYADPQVVRWVQDGSPITFAECREWLATTARNYRVRGYGMFALSLADSRDDALIGCCGLVHPGGQVQVELKYAFSQPSWGRGLASEMLQGLITYATEFHQLNPLCATVDPHNLASQRVLAKAGFEFVERRIDDDGLPEQYWQRSSP